MFGHRHAANRVGQLQRVRLKGPLASYVPSPQPVAMSFEPLPPDVATSSEPEGHPRQGQALALRDHNIAPVKITDIAL